jgi:serine/threonine-protein kinase
MMAAVDVSVREVGPYSIVRQLGRGGMGIVYEATHRQLGKRVAIKVLDPRRGDESRARARFTREARAAAQLRHPNVVEVLDAGEDCGHAFLVMDLLEGPTLEEWLRDHGPIEPSAAADLLLPVASAICAAHESGVIHRDLKPGNIIITRSRSGALVPVVVDFGISKLVDEQELATRSNAILGTLPYLAPELTRSASSATPASDQYALGVILYECTTGRRPFSGASPYDLLHAIVMTSPSAPSAINPALPGGFDEVVMRAMAREPGARHPSVHALASALLSFASRRTWAAWGPEFAGVDPSDEGFLSETNPELDAPPLPRASTARGPEQVRARMRARLVSVVVPLIAGAALGAAAVGLLRRPRVVSAAADSCPQSPAAESMPPRPAQQEPLLSTIAMPASAAPAEPRAASPVPPPPAREAPPAMAAPAKHVDDAPKPRPVQARKPETAPPAAPPTPTAQQQPRDDTPAILGANQAPILR